MKVGDLVRVLPYKVKLRARWNNETRSEDYVGQCGTVTEIMEELCGEALNPTQVYVAFCDGFVGMYSLGNLEKYNPLSIDEDIAYFKKNLFESLNIPKDYLNENFTRCFYCSSVFSDNEFDDDYAICGKCRDKENEE